MKETIDLPLDLELNERVSYVNKLLEKYPEDFRYKDNYNTDRIVGVRLDILATYMLNKVENIRNDVMSRYKEKNRPVQEQSISNFMGCQRYQLESLYFSNSDISVEM